MKNIALGFQNKFLPALAKLGDLKYMVVLRDGMIITIPFTIFGSIFMIVANLPFTWWTNFIKPISGYLNAAVTVTFGILALIVAMGISYQSAKANKLDTMTGTVIPTVAFLLAMLNDKLTINPADLGSGGIFTAIVVCILASEVIRFCVARNWTIELPDSVPPAVAKSFSSLIPGSIALFIVWLIRVVLHININSVITAIFSPLVVGLDSIWGIELAIFLVLALWVVGVHGTNVIGSIYTPVFLTFLTANINAVSKGQAPVHIAADGFLNFGLTIGGTGAILGLVLCMFTAKSKRYKAMRNLGLMPSIFNISEPIMFGLPVVLNPTLMVPFIVTPMVLEFITYYLMKFGVIGMIVAQVPWTTPTIISGFLMTGGDWRASVWQLIELIVAVAAYYPFFRMLDRQELKTEQKEKTDEQSSESSSQSVSTVKGA
ncbi:PTS sugar transporter subunit IIC [Lactiplantibacillus pentosus]|uniref:PTS sugar transporter subunit IIC n=1 Tax=Lactiplantibacillus pentosus TaxID=1589 RepID=UPI0021A356C8|nr:PTS transporter subunit EIIC [Lactiplantibacillus pentosus]MCT3294872.1 PTS sugar transporter subunit IIC [Lactiplantibacillus pentosus]